MIVEIGMMNFLKSCKAFFSNNLPPLVDFITGSTMIGTCLICKFSYESF